MALRERWATLTNEALREANIEARVDHRSLAAQGIDRKPLVHIPMEFYQLESRGMKSEVAERLREDYRARVAARLERTAARPTERVEQATPQREEAVDPRNVEEIRRRAVREWLRMRPKEAESSVSRDADSQRSQQNESEQQLDRD